MHVSHYGTVTTLLNQKSVCFYNLAAIKPHMCKCVMQSETHRNHASVAAVCSLFSPTQCLLHCTKYASDHTISDTCA